MSQKYSNEFIISFVILLLVLFKYIQIPYFQPQLSTQHFDLDTRTFKTPSISQVTNELKNKVKTKKNIPKYVDQQCPDGIDVVWLWVNGSDPVFREEYIKHGRKSGEGRYRDYNTLQYSIRSVYEYAPYIKNYYIVTMNQVPSFLNTSQFTFEDYTMRIVDHKEIFPNNEDLPVFNSNSLEVSLHNIKGLKSCFLYLNDDMLLGKELKPIHFLSENGKLNIYHNSWKAPNENKMQRNIWHRSVGNSNERLNKHFGLEINTKHYYVAHHCYFFKTDTLKEMEQLWPEDYVEIRKRKFRNKEDLAVPYLHNNLLFEQGKANLIKETDNVYGTFTEKRSSNLKLFNKIKKKHPQCICMNDAIQGISEKDLQREVSVLNGFMEHQYPYPSPFEKDVIFV